MSRLLFMGFESSSGGPTPVIVVGPQNLAPRSTWASSSALGLGDIALTWAVASGDADLEKIDGDIATDRGLVTAALLSLFLDRRAEDDDVPPSGDPLDRRGWWADQFADVGNDKIGSRLWLLDRAKNTNETALRAKEYAAEALAWMIDDSVVSTADVVVEAGRDRLLFAVGLQRPNGARVTLRFAHVWEHLQEGA